MSRNCKNQRVEASRRVQTHALRAVGQEFNSHHIMPLVATNQPPTLKRKKQMVSYKNHDNLFMSYKVPLGFFL